MCMCAWCVRARQFRVVHDDGDEEDLDEDEVEEAKGDYDTLAPREARWLRVGHELLGKRVLRSFEGAATLGTITRWLPADSAEGDPALFRVRDRERTQHTSARAHVPRERE
jgi:hypothetical protein